MSTPAAAVDSLTLSGVDRFHCSFYKHDGSGVEVAKRTM